MIRNAPRMRGGDPHFFNVVVGVIVCSPHARG